MFVGDFNSKLESFGCAHRNSGPMLKNIQKQLNLIYLNHDEHTHMDRAKGSTDILDLAFISPNLAKHDIQFQIGDDLGSDHLPIEISIETPPHRNTFTNHTKYKFDQTDREVFKSTLEEALGSVDFSGHLSTSNPDKYADFIITAIHTAVDKAILTSKSMRPESNPISSEVNKFIEDNHKYFYPPEGPDDYRFDIGNEHELVADVDAQTLIKLVKFLKRGKAPGPDTIHNEVLRLGTTTSLFHHLAKLFTSSIQLGYIPTAWKIATLHMLLKPDKLPSPYH